MLFGYHTNPRTTVVTAAHTLQEFQDWYASLVTEEALFTSAHETNMFEHLTNDEWSDLKTSVYVFTFDHDYNQAEFARIHDIVVLPRFNAVDRNADMEYVSREFNAANDTRTIAEIHGLGDDDPYDKRSEEEKAADKIVSERMKELQKQDKISGDSFSPVTKGGVSVTDIHATTNTDGTITIDGINAVKYKGDEAENAMEQMTRVSASPYEERRTKWQEGAEIVDLTQTDAVLNVTEIPLEDYVEVSDLDQLLDPVEPITEPVVEPNVDPVEPIPEPATDPVIEPVVDDKPKAKRKAKADKE